MTAQEAFDNAAKAFTQRNPASQRQCDDATSSMPGGNTRSTLHYTPFPLSMAKAKGSTLFDLDGHEYVDLLGEYTASIYGHSDPVIAKAITDALERGLNFGSQHRDEARLAALIKTRFPSIDLLRFTNSGTEANLMALAAAKVYTSKKKILVFSGGYHGGVFAWKGGKGSPVNAPHEYLIAKYNDTESVKALLEQAENAKDVAAIIVEPMIGSGGGIPATHDFLISLRRLATEHGAVLIFDEVMTSRMHSGGGIQSQLPEGLRPDMTSLGKYIGGGMSFGAFGGGRDIMSMFDPRQNRLVHSGTFNNNVLTMAAGIAGMERLFTPARARELHETGEAFRERLRRVCQGTNVQWTGCGSILCVHFLTLPADRIACPEDIAHADLTLSNLLHLFLLERGYYIGRRGFIALSLTLTKEDLDGFVQSIEEFVRTYRPLLAVN